MFSDKHVVTVEIHNSIREVTCSILGKIFPMKGSVSGESLLGESTNCPGSI